MDDKESILLADVSIHGDLVEKEKIIIDAKINGDISAGTIETHENSEVNWNIKSKNSTLGGRVKGNINSEKIELKKNSNVEGVLNQKILKIEEGAILKIKTETHK